MLFLHIKRTSAILVYLIYFIDFMVPWLSCFVDCLLIFKFFFFVFHFTGISIHYTDVVLQGLVLKTLFQFCWAVSLFFLIFFFIIFWLARCMYILHRYHHTMIHRFLFTIFHFLIVFYL
jgi:hypothetical protein